MRSHLVQVGKRAIKQVHEILENRGCKLNPEVTLDNDNRSIIQVIYGDGGLMFENYSPYEVANFLFKNHLVQRIPYV